MSTRPARAYRALVVASLWLATTLACGSQTPAPPLRVAGSGDARFSQLASDIVADHERRNPTAATDLGIHTYDERLEDFTARGLAEEAAAARSFRQQIDAIDPGTLTLDRQLDREQLIRALDSRVLSLEAIKAWTKDPDECSSGITNAAFVLIKRNFASPSERLTHLIARERQMPAALAEARRNLENPPRIYVEIAIEQIDGNRHFFEVDVPAAFNDVTDAALLTAFRRANASVIAALGEYKMYLTMLLPKATGRFAIGAEAYAKKLSADEMIDLPLDRLLQIAEADRQRNEEAYVATAKQIDPGRSTAEVLATLQLDRPPASTLLSTTQGTLDALRQFISDHHIVTIPSADAARVKETPPFMRSTTTASMDTPGPFERARTDAFYYMTLPDPRWSAAKQADYMRQWYHAAISNVTVHEVYPGHYVQFLYAKLLPSDVRKVYGANTNIEGWAHYCEQMVLDEGFHAEDPRYRLAQLQDALLRDVRFIVGIKMHTEGMTVEEAGKLFEAQGHQPAPVAMEEAKRGTSDPTYGYYTMGKLMILKLRDDYRARMGSAYTLEGFHNALMTLGPLPIPLIRTAMLGETGALFR